MSKLRVNCFAVSLDGFGAGPNQNLDHPLGFGRLALHQWEFPIRTVQRMYGGEDCSTGVDNEFDIPE